MPSQEAILRTPSLYEIPTPLLNRIKNALVCRFADFRTYDQQDYSELIGAFFNQLIGEFAVVTDKLLMMAGLPTAVPRQPIWPFNQLLNEPVSASIDVVISLQVNNAARAMPADPPFGLPSNFDFPDPVRRAFRMVIADKIVCPSCGTNTYVNEQMLATVKVPIADGQDEAARPLTVTNVLQHEWTTPIELDCRCERCGNTKSRISTITQPPPFVHPR